MAQDQKFKMWHPAHFTHGRIRGLSDEQFGPDVSMQHTIIILNNPLDNKNLLVDVCIDGMHYVKAGDSGFTAKATHQLVALFVPMAEQTDSMICTSLGRRKKIVSVSQVFVDCCFVDNSSSPMPYAEIWTPYVPTWRNTIEAKTLRSSKIQTSTQRT